jgi:hypothetical protein
VSGGAAGPVELELWVRDARDAVAVQLPGGRHRLFAIANYPWLQRPSKAAVLALWQKVGINLVRISYAGG